MTTILSNHVVSPDRRLVIRLDARHLRQVESHLRLNAQPLTLVSNLVRVPDATLALVHLPSHQAQQTLDPVALAVTARYQRHPISDIRWLESLRHTSSANYDPVQIHAEILVHETGADLVVWQGRDLYAGPVDIQLAPPLTHLRAFPSFTPAIGPASMPPMPRTGHLLVPSAALQRWLHTRVGVVGVGRSGTCMISNLVSQGCRHLTLIDGDSLEWSNLDGMDLVGRRQLTLPKVKAVSENLKRLHEDVNVSTVDLPLGTPESIAALAGVDVIACTIDHAAPRLIAAWLAHKLMVPLLDIGTAGIAEGWGSVGDVRLILPGDRCLLCTGGINPPDPSRRPGTSPRVINVIATACGVSMLLEAMANPWRARSAWVRIEINDGAIRSRQIQPIRSDVPCPWCHQLDPQR